MQPPSAAGRIWHRTEIIGAALEIRISKGEIRRKAEIRRPEG
jgi:hypothetical protein